MRSALLAFLFLAGFAGAPAGLAGGLADLAGPPAAWAETLPPPPPPGEVQGVFRFPSGDAAARAVPLALDEAPIRIWLPLEVEEARATKLLATLDAFLSQLPADHRTALHTVAFDPGEFPGNARKARLLNSPELKLWASAKAGIIVFYRNTPPGDWRVSRRRVFHEMGHCLAHQRFGSSTPPAAWTDAARADDAFFSDYSRNAFEATGTLVEDFADAYAAYMQAIADGGGEALATFRASYPARARLLEVYTGQTAR